MGSSRQSGSVTDKHHIVLSSSDHKPILIAASTILSEYWRRINRAMNMTDVVILFGYSGNDDHLNSLISDTCVGKRVCVIEWDQAGSAASRQQHWKQKLPKCLIELHQLPDLMSFTQWASI
jgi:hypothetical protein